ncbi:hypothetical protein BDV98DRAFT_141663 [Pterulicium gracile]|uniref:Uncharacterized protein n=1 Tax=Pterulicium gracile TaxID=1884261 RepID=A0A5C3R0T5_9AGAR|nr:hypothetical protein BDV98DRAFT_141663 [Pterula gracilis]
MGDSDHEKTARTFYRRVGALFGEYGLEGVLTYIKTNFLDCFQRVAQMYDEEKKLETDPAVDYPNDVADYKLNPSCIVQTVFVTNQDRLLATADLKDWTPVHPKRANGDKLPGAPPKRAKHDLDSEPMLIDNQSEVANAPATADPSLVPLVPSAPHQVMQTNTPSTSALGNPESAPASRLIAPLPHRAAPAALSSISGENAQDVVIGQEVDGTTARITASTSHPELVSILKNTSTSSLATAQIAASAAHHSHLNRLLEGSSSTSLADSSPAPSSAPSASSSRVPIAAPLQTIAAAGDTMLLQVPAPSSSSRASGSTPSADTAAPTVAARFGFRASWPFAPRRSASGTHSARTPSPSEAAEASAPSSAQSVLTPASTLPVASPIAGSNAAAAPTAGSSADVVSDDQAEMSVTRK